MSNPNGRKVRLERHGRVLVLTVDRLDVRNAVDREVAEQIAAGLDELDAAADLAVGVLTGAGGTFSAGMDLKAFARGELPIVEGRGLAGFATAPPRKPLIAAVEGHAVGGGFEMALACDLIVAAVDARFGLPEVRRGLLATGGALVRLPRRISRNQATELILTGATIDGARAFDIGLVNRIVPSGEALAAAIELAVEIAANAPLALAAAKEMIAFADEFPEREAWERQVAIRARVVKSEDAREGALAFSEKRKPVWMGR